MAIVLMNKVYMRVAAMSRVVVMVPAVMRTGKLVIVMCDTRKDI